MTARWLAAFAAADLVALLPWRPRRTSVYASFTDPEPVPPDWQAIEPRWDCLPCRSTQAAEILPTSYRCLKCGTEGFIATP